MENTWQEDFQSDFLKVCEGIHTLRVFEEPEKISSGFGGKEQWCFDVKLDGIRGKLCPSKRLGALIAQVHGEKGTFPVELQFKRKGMDIKTSYTLMTQAEIDLEDDAP